MIDNKKVLAVTLARGGSKGIYKKNICIIHGFPLIYYTIKEVKLSKYIDRYIISTDDLEIKEICKGYNCEVIDRPNYLASDSTSSSEALIHVVKDLDYDYIIEVMCTNPLKSSLDLDCCIEKLHNENSDSVVSVVQLFDHHPSRIKYIEKGILQDFYPEVIESRRQDLSPKAYIRNGSIYAMKKDFLLLNKARYGKNTLAYVMPSERSINIDNIDDLMLAEIKLQA